jgi:hypothetical protein
MPNDQTEALLMNSGTGGEPPHNYPFKFPVCG